MDEGEFPRKKPKNLKNWWESDFYQNPKPKTYPRRKTYSKNKTRRKTQPSGEHTYLGHPLLPPNLEGEI